MDNIIDIVIASQAIYAFYMVLMTGFFVGVALLTQVLGHWPRDRLMEKMVGRLQALGEIEPSAVSARSEGSHG